MAKKKKKNNSPATSNEEFDLVGLLDNLSAGTKFTRVSEADMLHARPKVRTPLPHLDVIFGGGIPFGVIVEGFGPPKAGKSTFWYETLGEFQRQYPNGVPIIVDTEMSVDNIRMQYMGIDTDKVLRLPAMTLEDGFEQVINILKKKRDNEKAKDLPVFIMWDTIAVAPSRAQHKEGNINAGGMTQKPRLIKQFLSDVLVYIEEQPTIFVLLNQVFTDLSGFRPKLTSGGGNGLKHDIHIQLQFKKAKSSFDGDGREIKQTSKVDINKSKISPKFQDINMTIDNTTGGTVDRLRSFMNYLRDSSNIFIDNRGWIQMNSELFDEDSKYLEYEPIIQKPNKKWRWDELVDAVKADPNWTRFLQMLLVDEIAKHYKYYHDISRKYRRNLYLQLQYTLITRGLINEIKEEFEVDNPNDLTEDQIRGLSEEATQALPLLQGEMDLDLVEKLVHTKLENEMSKLDEDLERTIEETQKASDESLSHVEDEDSNAEYSDGYEGLEDNDDDDDNEEDEKEEDTDK